MLGENGIIGGVDIFTQAMDIPARDSLGNIDYKTKKNTNQEVYYSLIKQIKGLVGAKVLFDILGRLREDLPITLV